MGLSTHILDTTRGRPAAGVTVALERLGGGTWTAAGSGVTDADGRVKSLLPEGVALAAGEYRVRFEVGAYFAALGVEAFYPRVEIAFTVRAPHEHHHVPLLLNPFGYSTYRGS